MSYRKTVKGDDETDGIDRDNLGRSLRCSVPGCKDRWSVWIEKGFCSYHQWGKGQDAATTVSVFTKEVKAAMKRGGNMEEVL